MALHEKDDNELIVALVKAAIGESQMLFRSYEMDHKGLGCEASITIDVCGDVEGKLQVKGRAAQKVQRLFQVSQMTDARKRAEERAEKLSKKLAQLHALSDPES